MFAALIRLDRQVTSSRQKLSNTAGPTNKQKFTFFPVFAAGRVTLVTTLLFTVLCTDGLVDGIITMYLLFMSRFWKPKWDEITGFMQRSQKAFCIVGSNIIFCSLLSLMLFWCGSQDTDLWWIPFVLIWEDRFPWERHVCVSKRQRDAHTVVLLPSAVSMDTHRCKSRETTKRENASAVCFMRGFCQRKMWLQSYSFWHFFFYSYSLWGLKTVESREIREPKMKPLLSFTQTHAIPNLCFFFFFFSPQEKSSRNTNDAEL